MSTPIHTINPLENNSGFISDDFIELCNNAELYFAPKKIKNFSEMTKEEIKLHLMEMFGTTDERFCELYACVIKKDTNGLDGKPLMTAKEARNYMKKLIKKR